MEVGADAPVSVQSMTNTVTSDVAATARQIGELALAGADIVRVSCPDEASTAAFAALVAESPVPLVADIHFHYRRAIEAAEAGAACLRINPGNIGSARRVREVVAAARDHGCSMRIGVNAGSLEKHLLERHGGPTPTAMVESALAHARILEDNGFVDFKISVKASDVGLARLSRPRRGLRPPAPSGHHRGRRSRHRHGQIRGRNRHAAVGGHRDTIRVSLATDPVEEVRVGWEILKSLRLRQRGRHRHRLPVLPRASAST